MRNSFIKYTVGIASFFMIGSMLTAPLATHASFGQFEEGTVYVPETATFDSFFVGGGSTVEIDGVMNDDIVVFGASITVNGSVDGDVFAFGSVIIINGTVTGSVRGAGSTVTINGTVGKNVTVAGAVITIAPEASVGKNLAAAGAQIHTKGAVGKNIHAAGASIVVDGTVGGSVYAIADEEGRLEIRPNAIIGGNVEYSAFREASVYEGAQIVGTTDFTKINDVPAPAMQKNIPKERPVRAVFLTFRILATLGLMLVGFVFVSLFKQFNKDIQKETGGNVLFSFFKGFATIIITPILLVLLMVTVLGIPLALIGFCLYFVTLYVAKLVAAVWAGDLIIRTMRKEADKNKAINQHLSVLVGVTTVCVLMAVPFVGMLLSIFVTAWGVGVLITVSRMRLGLK